MVALWQETFPLPGTKSPNLIADNTDLHGPESSLGPGGNWVIARDLVIG